MLSRKWNKSRYLNPYQEMIWSRQIHQNKFIFHRTVLRWKPSRPSPLALILHRQTRYFLQKIMITSNWSCVGWQTDFWLQVTIDSAIWLISELFWRTYNVSCSSSQSAAPIIIKSFHDYLFNQIAWCSFMAKPTNSLIFALNLLTDNTIIVLLIFYLQMYAIHIHLTHLDPGSYLMIFLSLINWKIYWRLRNDFKMLWNPSARLSVTEKLSWEDVLKCIKACFST